MRTALLLVLATGCAHARFENDYGECGPGGATRAELGYAEALRPPEGFGEGAATNYVAAPPWLDGQPRVFPIDSSFRYDELLPPQPVLADTPLLCELEYRAQTRARLGGGRTRRWLSADALSGADLSVIYEVAGKGPSMRVAGARDGDRVGLVDAANRFDAGDLLRFTAVDRDRFSDDVLASLQLSYAEPLAASTGMRASGSITVRCHHLDPTATQRAREAALHELDLGLTSFTPALEPEAWHFGLTASGMGELRTLATRVASLGGWADSALQARVDRMLGMQACFERATMGAVGRRADRVRWTLGDSERERWRARAFVCGDEPAPRGDPWPQGRCTLAVEIEHDYHEAEELDLGIVTLVLAGGREVDVSVDEPVVLEPGSASSVTLRLEPSVAAAVALTRPMLVRRRRWRIFRKEFDVIDRALWEG